MFFNNVISVPVSYEIFYKQIRANLPSKSADPFDASRNFCKRERKREGVRLSRGSVFYIGVGINFYSMSPARDRFFSSRWIRLWVSTNRYTSRVRRLITNREPPGVKYTRDFIDIQLRTSKNSYAVREEGPRQPYVRGNT